MISMVPRLLVRTSDLCRRSKYWNKYIQLRQEQIMPSFTSALSSPSSYLRGITTNRVTNAPHNIQEGHNLAVHKVIAISHIIASPQGAENTKDAPSKSSG